MNTTNIHGIIAYPITPFTKDDKPDIPLFKALTERLVQAGAHAIAPLGSTGVLPYLNDEEKEAVTEATIAQVRGRVPVIAGVSALTTERTVYHARFAEKAGATALMVIPMSYWKLTEGEIVRHFEKVASAVSVPVMAYNNPATGGIDMSPALLKRLLQVPNICMIKESTGDIQRMHYLRKELGEEAPFFNGSNPLALAAFAAGARGWCTAAPNLIPELTLALYNAVQANDLQKARELYYRQADLLRFIVNTGLPRAVQAGLKLLGVEGGYLRSPLSSLSSEETHTLAALLEKCGKKPQAGVAV